MEEMLRLISIHSNLIKSSSNKSKHYFNRGQCLMKIGIFDNAIADFTEAIKLDDKPEYRLFRGLAYEKAKDEKTAWLDFKEVEKDKSLVKAIQELELDSEYKPISYWF